jgi:hypothetical protein
VVGGPFKTQGGIGKLGLLLPFTVTIRFVAEDAAMIAVNPHGAIAMVAVERASGSIDGNQVVEVPLIVLLPAAKVRVEVTMPESRISVMPAWVIEEESAPVWATEWLGLMDSPPRITGPIFAKFIETDMWLPVNQSQMVSVPAGLTIRLRLDPPQRSVSLCLYIYAQSFCAEQGQTIDLGPCTLEQAMTVCVKVVDPRGRPVDGVPVRMKIGRVWQVPHLSNREGLVPMSVPPHTQGEFGVCYRNERAGTPSVVEAIPFELGGPQDEGRLFTLQLSDEMVHRLSE